MIIVKEIYWEVAECGNGVKERINFQCGFWTYKDMKEAKEALKSFKEKLVKEKNWEIDDEGENWFRAKNNLSYLVFEIKEVPENTNTYIDLY